LEEFFTLVEGFTSIIRLLKKGTKNYRLDRINAVRKNLMQAIASVFEESLCDRFVAKYEAKPCEYHQTLVASLKKQDTIISFNYDCVIDQNLKKFGSEKWHARYGYGLPQKWNYPGVDFWEADKPSSKADTIELLKLHGSLNWQFDENRKRIKFKDRPYTRQYGDMRFSIIPPEAHKVLKAPYSDLWYRAGHALRDAKHLVFIGYSFVSTDIDALSLFRIMANKNLKTLTIVNPDRLARQKTRQTLVTSISPSTLVLDFESFKEYTNYLNSIMTKSLTRKSKTL